MKRVLKLIGYIAGGLLVVILLCVGTVYAITSARIAKTYSTTIPALAIPGDSASIARGRHLVENVGKCQACHGDDYSGKVFMDDPVFVQLTSANITRGKDGIGASYTDEEFRALAEIEDGLQIVGTGGIGSKIWSGPGITVLGIDCPAVEGAPASGISQRDRR